MPSPGSSASQTRAIVLLAFASFASQSMVRVTDSLLPQIAADVGTTVGTASIVVTAYAITHGSMQLFIGPLGDRFGKYRSVTGACALSCLAVLVCGLAQSLPVLALARLASGATAAWVIPLSMAYVGDVTPLGQRQQVLGRFLSGQIAGQLFGQVAGGVLGDWFGWRSVFFVLAALFAIAAIGLAREMMVNPVTRARKAGTGGFAALLNDYRVVLGNPWARLILFAVFVEAGVAYGTFAYVGADLHFRFGLSFTLVGVIVATFGVGGLIYALAVKQLVTRLGQSGIALYGGLLMAGAFVCLAFLPAWQLAPVIVTLIGLGFYMLHNTLQTNATQMSPDASGTALALFASAIYFGQFAVVPLAAPWVDRYGAQGVFVTSGVMLAALAIWFAGRLRRRGD